LGRAAHRLARKLGLACHTLHCGYAVLGPHNERLGDGLSAQQVINICLERERAKGGE